MPFYILEFAFFPACWLGLLTVLMRRLLLKTRCTKLKPFLEIQFVYKSSILCILTFTYDIYREG